MAATRRFFASLAEGLGGLLAPSRGASALPPGVERKIALARLSLVAEALAGALWPAQCLLMGFLALALLGFFSALPFALHLLFLITFFGVAAWLAVRGLARAEWPDRAAAEARLEADANLANQPLRSFEDQPAGKADAVSQGLWRAHRARLARAFGRLKWPHPRHRLDTEDPLALRYAALMALVIALVVAGGEADERLAGAFLPAPPASSGAAGAEPIAWITPPDYTGRPPVYLDTDESDEADMLSVPAGSVLTLRLSGEARGRLTARPLAPEAGGSERIPFAGDGDLGEATLTLEESVVVTYLRGLSQTVWRIAVIADQPPAIAWADDLARTQRAALRVPYEVIDDYAVAESELVVSREEQGALVEEHRSLGAARTLGEPVSAAQFVDLSDHPWAGLEVNVQLRARDDLGQTALSESRRIILPERRFQHPLARELIEARRSIAADPKAVPRIRNHLDALSRDPALRPDDLTVYLGMRVAHLRLARDESELARNEVIDLLWNLALRLEDGDLTLAQAALRDSLQALQDAIEAGAGDAEIAERMAAVEDALRRYMEAFAEAGLQPPDRRPAQSGVDARDIGEMMSEIRTLMETGSTNAARQRLADLADMVERLSAPQPLSAEAEAMMEAYQGLRDLIEAQVDLIDETFRIAERLRADRERQVANDLMRIIEPDRPREEPAPAFEGEAALTALAGDQDALRRGLDALSEILSGPLPQSRGTIERADRAMEGAGEALGEGVAGRALRQQQRAQEALNQLAETLIEALGEESGSGMAAGAGPSPGRDPFGRPLGPDGGALRDGRVEVPDAGEVERARRILDEIRRRLDDRTRPREEQDYLERLTPRF